MYFYCKGQYECAGSVLLVKIAYLMQTERSVENSFLVQSMMLVHSALSVLNVADSVGRH